MGAPSKIALSGFIGNTHDALIVFEGEWLQTNNNHNGCLCMEWIMLIHTVFISCTSACRRGLLPRATGRLSEAERKAIKSGDIFVFNEEESQIKR